MNLVLRRRFMTLMASWVEIGAEVVGVGTAGVVVVADEGTAAGRRLHKRRQYWTRWATIKMPPQPFSLDHCLKTEQKNGPVCIRFSEGWSVWSHCPNSKSKGQENSIEFPLDSCPDFILLYMVCAQYWLSRYSMTCLLIPSYHSIADLAKCGDHGPISPYKSRPALLRPRPSPVHRPLFL